MPDEVVPPAQVRTAALVTAKLYLDSVESNVVQDHIVMQAVHIAIDVMTPHLRTPEPPPEPVVKKRWWQR